MQHKKQAFTLSELLIVLVIIGVLSAVVLPKFTKILEARRTMEAENMMTAVRNEQEARCVLGKNYANINNLDIYAKGGKGSKNFTYSNRPGSAGIVAVRSDKGKKYQLSIPSYADGRICCTGDGCADLGKSYPTCNELVNKADYVAPNAGCAVKVTAPECRENYQEGYQETEPCGCDGTGERIKTWQGAPVCNWKSGPCSKPETGCDESPETGCTPKEDCPDNEHQFWRLCTCVQCKGNMTHAKNADGTWRDACVCTLGAKEPSKAAFRDVEEASKDGAAYCAEQDHQVFWTNATSTNNFSLGVPACDCKTCADMPGSAWPEEAGSKDGTFGGCSLCTLTKEDCRDGKRGAAKGTVLGGEEEDGTCSCKTCHEMNARFTAQAVSSDGTVAGCTNCPADVQEACVGPNAHLVWFPKNSGMPQAEKPSETNQFSRCECRVCEEGETWNTKVLQCVKCQKTENDCDERAGQFLAPIDNNGAVAGGYWSIVGYYAKLDNDSNAEYGFKGFLNEFKKYDCECLTCAQIAGEETAVWSASKNMCVWCDQERFPGKVWNDLLPNGGCDIKCTKTENDCDEENGEFLVPVDSQGVIQDGYQYAPVTDFKAYLGTWGKYDCACKTCADILDDPNAVWSGSEKKCITCGEGKKWFEEKEGTRACLACTMDGIAWEEQSNPCQTVLENGKRLDGWIEVTWPNGGRHGQLSDAIRTKGRRVLADNEYRNFGVKGDTKEFKCECKYCEGEYQKVVWKEHESKKWYDPVCECDVESLREACLANDQRTDEKNCTCVGCKSDESYNAELDKCIKCTKTENDCDEDNGEFLAALYSDGSKVMGYVPDSYAKAKNNFEAFLKKYGQYSCGCVNKCELEGHPEATWSTKHKMCLACDIEAGPNGKDPCASSGLRFVIRDNSAPYRVIDWLTELVLQQGLGVLKDHGTSDTVNLPCECAEPCESPFKLNLQEECECDPTQLACGKNDRIDLDACACVPCGKETRTGVFPYTCECQLNDYNCPNGRKNFETCECESCHDMDAKYSTGAYWYSTDEDSGHRNEWGGEEGTCLECTKQVGPGGYDPCNQADSKTRFVIKWPQNSFGKGQVHTPLTREVLKKGREVLKTRNFSEAVYLGEKGYPPTGAVDPTLFPCDCDIACKDPNKAWDPATLECKCALTQEDCGSKATVDSDKCECKACEGMTEVVNGECKCTLTQEDCGSKAAVDSDKCECKACEGMAEVVNGECKCTLTDEDCYPGIIGSGCMCNSCYGGKEAVNGRCECKKTDEDCYPGYLGKDCYCHECGRGKHGVSGACKCDTECGSNERQQDDCSCKSCPEKGQNANWGWENDKANSACICTLDPITDCKNNNQYLSGDCTCKTCEKTNYVPDETGQACECGLDAVKDCKNNNMYLTSDCTCQPCESDKYEPNKNGTACVKKACSRTCSTGERLVDETWNGNDYTGIDCQCVTCQEMGYNENFIWTGRSCRCDEGKLDCKGNTIKNTQTCTCEPCTEGTADDTHTRCVMCSAADLANKAACEADGNLFVNRGKDGKLKDSYTTDTLACECHTCQEVNSKFTANAKNVGNNTCRECLLAWECTGANKHFIWTDKNKTTTPPTPLPSQSYSGDTSKEKYACACMDCTEITGKNIAKWDGNLDWVYTDTQKFGKCTFCNTTGEDCKKQNAYLKVDESKRTCSCKTCGQDEKPNDDGTQCVDAGCKLTSCSSSDQKLLDGEYYGYNFKGSKCACKTCADLGKAGKWEKNYAGKLVCVERCEKTQESCPNGEVLAMQDTQGWHPYTGKNGDVGHCECKACKDLVAVNGQTFSNKAKYFDGACRECVESTTSCASKSKHLIWGSFSNNVFRPLINGDKASHNDYTACKCMDCQDITGLTGFTWSDNLPWTSVYGRCTSCGDAKKAACHGNNQKYRVDVRDSNNTPRACSCGDSCGNPKDRVVNEYEECICVLNATECASRDGTVFTGANSCLCVPCSTQKSAKGLQTYEGTYKSSDGTFDGCYCPTAASTCGKNGNILTSNKQMVLPFGSRGFGYSCTCMSCPDYYEAQGWTTGENADYKNYKGTSEGTDCNNCPPVKS